MNLLLRFVLLAALCAPFARARNAEGKPVALLVAGTPSHKPGEHEYNAGVLLFARCLRQGAPDLVVKTFTSGAWPSGAELAEADTLLFYCDGGDKHLAIASDHAAQVAWQVKRGMGLVAVHYGVEFPTSVGPEVLEWLGGYFETFWSVNPHWVADFKTLPAHPVTAGVRPFTSDDEWYFHMRFDERTGRLTQILQAVPPASTMSRPDGMHSGNPTVRAEVAAGKLQSTAWAFEREDGGRAFGFTGGHFHRDWSHDDKRKLVLNAILWTARLTIPPNGVVSHVTEGDMLANLDDKPAPPTKKQSSVPSSPSPGK